MRFSEGRDHRNRLVQATIFLVATLMTVVGIAGFAKGAKAGKAVRLKVSVTNIGTADALGVKVRIRSSNCRVKVPRIIRISVPAGSQASQTIEVRAMLKA